MLSHSCYRFVVQYTYGPVGWNYLRHQGDQQRAGSQGCQWETQWPAWRRLETCQVSVFSRIQYWRVNHRVCLTKPLRVRRALRDCKMIVLTRVWRHGVLTSATVSGRTYRSWSSRVLNADTRTFWSWRTSSLRSVNFCNGRWACRSFITRLQLAG